MKSRNGFVSNSSSSSFTIAVKGELTEERILNALGVNENSIFYSFAKQVAQVLMPGGHFSNRFDSVESFLLDKAQDGYSEEEIREGYWTDVIRLLDKGYTLYVGSASDEGYGSDGAESWVCHTAFELEEEGLIIKSEGGY